MFIAILIKINLNVKIAFHASNVVSRHTQSKVEIVLIHNVKCALNVNIKEIKDNFVLYAMSYGQV